MTHHPFDKFAKIIAATMFVSMALAFGMAERSHLAKVMMALREIGGEAILVGLIVSITVIAIYVRRARKCFLTQLPNSGCPVHWVEEGGLDFSRS